MHGDHGPASPTSAQATGADPGASDQDPSGPPEAALRDLERAARDSLMLVLDDVAPDEIEPGRDLIGDYGLTSLNKVLFMTDVCERTGVSVAHFTERDVAAMRTLGDVVAALARHADPAGEGSPR